MNILEAFKASNCGKIRRPHFDKGSYVSEYEEISLKSALCDDWQPVNEPLTFERIRKECVTGETLLVDMAGDKRLYLGFSRKGQLVTDQYNGLNSLSLKEDDIKNWRISGKWVRGE